MKVLLIAFEVLIFVGVQPLHGQQLRTEYSEIRLSDKRVFSHARVETFDGLSFCISHASGIEAAIPWELMPSDWKTAFPRDPQLKERMSAAARTRQIEQPAPGSLKPSAEQKERAEQAANEQERKAEKMAKEEARQSEFNRAIATGVVLPGMTDEQCVRVLGKPTRKNFTAGDDGVSEQWVYPGELYLYLKNGAVTHIQGTQVPAPEPTPMHRSW